jgi:hypothetical protein
VLVTVSLNVLVADTLSPSEMQVITKPTPILGTADGEEFTKYKVEYANAADNVWHTINVTAAAELRK